MSNFKDLYKFSDKIEATQNARRARLLKEQKEKRQQQYSTGRNDESEKPKKYYKVNANFKDSLMLSEWMNEAPDDLEDFILVPCPKGTRCTFVVKSRLATLYYKSGKEFMTDIRTNLPKDTILDCFYAKEAKTIYIIDVLQYKARDFVDCDFAFRSYWIRSKFTEDEFHIHSSDNITLKIIDTFDFADPLQISHCYNEYPIFTDGTELDGYFYYHKEGSYTFGESPLVLWLFPFMVEELMPAYKVHPHYNTLKPESYSNYTQFIMDFNEQRKKKTRRSKNSTMDFETTPHIIEEDQDPIQESIDLEKYGDY